jgi:hypothetical protein
VMSTTAGVAAWGAPRQTLRREGTRGVVGCVAWPGSATTSAHGGTNCGQGPRLHQSPRHPWAGPRRGQQLAGSSSSSSSSEAHGTWRGRRRLHACPRSMFALPPTCMAHGGAGVGYMHVRAACMHCPLRTWHMAGPASLCILGRPLVAPSVCGAAAGQQRSAAAGGAHALAPCNRLIKVAGAGLIGPEETAPQTRQAGVRGWASEWLPRAHTNRMGGRGGSQRHCTGWRRPVGPGVAAAWGRGAAGSYHQQSEQSPLACARSGRGWKGGRALPRMSTGCGCNCDWRTAGNQNRAA